MKKLLSLILLLSFNIKAQHSKFQYSQNTPDYDETKNLSISAEYSGMQTRVSKEGVINLAKGFAQLQIPVQPAVAYELEQMNKENEPSLIIFIKVKTLRQRTVINTNILFDFDLFFIKREKHSFKSAAEIKKMIANHEIKPYITIRPVNPALADVNIWDISQMAALTRNN